MATQLFLQQASASFTDIAYGVTRAPLGIGVHTNPTYWATAALLAARGGGAVTAAINTINGPVNGIEYASAAPLEWVSPPLAADTTISGSITFNIRASENSMSANAGPQVIIERLDPFGAIQETVINSERAVEYGTAEAANNWSATPGAGIAFNKGDRIRVRVLVNDAGGTLVTGFTSTLWYNGSAAAGSGDSYVTFTETFSFASEPAGTTLYLTDTAVAALALATDEREMWTARGALAATATVNTTSGPISPVQWTRTAGGAALEWYSKPLQAVTLGGAIRTHIRSKVATSQAGIRLELAKTDSDGTNAVLLAAFNSAVALTTSNQDVPMLLGFDDVSLTDGQRLRLRCYFDDGPGFTTSIGVSTATLHYNDPTPASTSDSYITLSQTVAEYTGGGGGADPQPPRHSQLTQLLAQ